MNNRQKVQAKIYVTLYQTLILGITSIVSVLFSRDPPAIMLKTSSQGCQVAHCHHFGISLNRVVLGNGNFG